MELTTFLLYATLSFFYIISPGPAVFLAINNSISHDLTTVALSSLGNIVGLLFLSSISILGLGSLILASASLFLLVKIIGALYLVYLGLKQFKTAKDLNKQTPLENHPTSAIKTKKINYFLEGFLLAATNPKPILFFIAIFPQFLNKQISLVPQFIVMTGLFMVLSFLSLLSYGYLAKYAKNLFHNPSNMQWFHRITGGLFITIGAGLLQLRNQ